MEKYENIKIINCSERIIFYSHIHDDNKLNLVLDLDQTLIDAEYIFLEKNTICKNSKLFMFEQNNNLMIHGRKNLFDFLFEMKDKFNIYIYTNATESYSHKIAEFIENKFDEKIFSGIICRDYDNYYNLTKELDDFCLRNISKFNTIIIDDRNDIWDEKYHGNIIKIIEFKHPNYDDDIELDIIKNLLNKYYLYMNNENLHMIIPHINNLYKYHEY
jgi:TFIIF-interacting CTD phosphatase-like protein